MIRYGVATSAFQVEGAVAADGRGPSTWDEFCTRPGAVLDGSDATVACDSYHRVDEDLALLAGLGVASYRFSVAWPRVQPDGRGALNAAGLAHYDGFVDRLLDKGITPLPTLFHWDLPLALERSGGWPARDTVPRFVDYALAVTDRLADRVTTWATHNEPWCTAFLGHAAGVFAPGDRVPEHALAAAHHLLLSHALAADAVRAAHPHTEVGIVLNLAPVRCEPDGDPAAADVVDALQNRLWLDALAGGSYPVPLVAARDGDLDRIRASADWLGINYYTPFRVGPAADGRAGVGQDVDAFPGAPDFSFRPRPPLTTMGWEIDPGGLEDVLRRVAGQLPGLPLRVTENGAAFADTVVAEDGSVDDQDRVAYLRGHVEVVERLAAEGLPVTDYLAWSLLDNFEWAQGYTQRFGLVAVDPGTLRRVPKASYRWYAEHLRGRPASSALEAAGEQSPDEEALERQEDHHRDEDGHERPG
ncbi:MAG: GH1 family beta-glucosidase [Mycobacteriales bacterium]